MSTQTRYAYDTAINVKIVAIWCGGCGLAYGLPEGFIAQRREDHKAWTCPNGCSRSYRVGSSKAEIEAARLQDELNRVTRQRNSAMEDREDQRERRIKAERQRAAAKGQLTKTKNRIAAGVCPCCNRSFQNLGRHMAGRHPDYTTSEAS